MPEDLQQQINDIKSELAIFKRHEHFFDGERLRLDAVQDDIDESEITLSDVTTNDVSSTDHGFAPKSPADATKFLNGAATPAYALVKDSDLSTSDITTNDVSTTKHGLAPKAPNDATKFLDGTGAYDTVKDSDLSTSDITTNDLATTKHGFAPKAPNDTTKFLRGDATWAVPSAGGLSLAKGTIADNTNVAVSTGAGTNTDTEVTHGLGTTPVKITVSAEILAIGKTADTGGANKRGHAIAIYDTSSSDPILIDGHIFINKADNAADVATPRDLGLSGAEAFLVVGTPSADREKIKIQIVSIGATTFTFRINGVVVGTPEANDSAVTKISWIAEA